jgi:hypothetical protein
MKVHPIIWLLGNSGDVRHPKGSNDQQEENYEVEMALFFRVSFLVDCDYSGTGSIWGIAKICITI